MTFINNFLLDLIILILILLLFLLIYSMIMKNGVNFEFKNEYLFYKY
jgi:hypothetical protein